MRQRGIVAQLAVLVARNVVDLADGREHFGLLHSVNPEVRFEIEIQIQHVSWVASLLHGQGEDAFLYGFGRGFEHTSGLDRLDLIRYLLLFRRWRRTRQIWTLLIDNADSVRQRGVPAQTPFPYTTLFRSLADGREHFGLLHSVHPEVRFEIEIQIQHVSWVASLLHGQGEDAFLYGFG